MTIRTFLLLREAVKRDVSKMTLGDIYQLKFAWRQLLSDMAFAEACEILDEEVRTYVLGKAAHAN